MLRKNFHIIRAAFCGLLCTSLLAANPGMVFAAENGDESGYTEAAAPPEHTEAYNQAADTDAVKGWPEGPKIEAEAAVLMDVNTEAILYSKNANEQLYPASITKIMTTLLACENLNLKDSLVVSEAAAYGIESGSSSIYAETGEQFTVQQSLMAVMLESANEMALAVAEKTSGSVKKFVELMNQRAVQLGCKKTHFNNPNGLPDETHYTTAGDMAKIAKAAWFNPNFRKFCTKDTYEIKPTNLQPESRYLLNHHKMMAGRDYAYEGVLGGKTGYTEVAGNTLVTYAKRGDTILLAVVLKSVNGAYSDTAALLDYGFNSFEKVDLNVYEDPASAKVMANVAHILPDINAMNPFFYKRHVYVTVPTGTDVAKLEKKQAVLQNAIGPLRLKSKYYYNGQMVGWGMQYEKEILSDLLLVPSS